VNYVGAYRLWTSCVVQSATLDVNLLSARGYIHVSHDLQIGVTHSTVNISADWRNHFCHLWRIFRPMCFSLLSTLSYILLLN